MSLSVIPAPIITLKDLVKRVLAQHRNAHTQRAYERHLRLFVRSGKPLTRGGVIEFLETVERPSNHLAARAALRKLAIEAEEAGYISADESRSIMRIKGRDKVQVRLGHWLTVEGVQKLRALPNRNSMRGARDAALIGILAGCGLRCNEVAGVTWDQYRRIDGRMVLVDITGKGGRIRSVPVPDWAAQEIDNWHAHLMTRYVQLGFEPDEGDRGPIMRGLGKLMPDDPLGAMGVAHAIKGYSDALELRFTPHDLRRTLAKLMRQAGVPIEQIQFTLGHAGVQTTERYLGGAIELGEGKAGVDQIPW